MLNLSLFKLIYKVYFWEVIYLDFFLKVHYSNTIRKLRYTLSILFISNMLLSKIIQFSQQILIMKKSVRSENLRDIYIFFISQ